MFDNHFVLLANVRNGEKIQIAPRSVAGRYGYFRGHFGALNHARQKKKHWFFSKAFHGFQKSEALLARRSQVYIWILAYLDLHDSFSY
jgi:hypothetical protein